jgi:hypothetical protein
MLIRIKTGNHSGYLKDKCIVKTGRDSLEFAPFKPQIGNPCLSMSILMVNPCV